MQIHEKYIIKAFKCRNIKEHVGERHEKYKNK